MSIKMTPKKCTLKETVKECLNAEHDSWKNMTPDKVKKILTCTAEQARENMIAEYEKELGDDIYNYFLANSEAIFKSIAHDITEYHKQCTLVINDDHARFARQVIEFLRKAGGKIEYSPIIRKERFGVGIKAEFTSSLIFDEQKDMLQALMDSGSLYISTLYNSNKIMLKCEFYELGKYVRKES